MKPTRGQLAILSVYLVVALVLVVYGTLHASH